MKRPRLLFIGAFPPADSSIFGGQVSACRALLNSTFPHNFDLFLLDTTQISNPPPVLLVRTLHAVKRLFVFVSRLIFKKPDAVMLFAAVGASLIEKATMARLARFRGIPTLLFPRGAEVIQTFRSSSWAKIWLRWVFRSSDLVLCQGAAWQRFLIDDLHLLPERVPIIFNWTATSALLAIGNGRTYNERLEGTQLLFLGWLEREKGIFELLQACSRLAVSHQFRLRIAGGGHAEKEARQFVEAGPLAGRVEFVGWIQDDVRNQLLASSDVLILPSYAEGFPNAIIEAMAAGLAVIVTAVGNVPDILTHEQEVLLVPPKDTSALENSMKRLLDDVNLRHKLSLRGHEFAKNNFSVEPAAANLSAAIRLAMVLRNMNQESGLRK